jgi:hypothetical protein
MWMKLKNISWRPELKFTSTRLFAIGEVEDGQKYYIVYCSRGLCSLIVYQNHYAARIKFYIPESMMYPMEQVALLPESAFYPRCVGCCGGYDVG